jgi:Transposase DDE domain
MLVDHVFDLGRVDVLPTGDDQVCEPVADVQVLQAVLTGWLRRRLAARPTAGRKDRVVIAVDGKVLRGARLPDGRQVHLLSAYDADTGIVLAQVAIAAKSNEIPAFTPLLDQLQAHLGSLAGTIIVADALHAQVSCCSSPPSPVSCRPAVRAFPPTGRRTRGRPLSRIADAEQLQGPVSFRADKLRVPVIVAASGRRPRIADGLPTRPTALGRSNLPLTDRERDHFSLTRGDGPV